MILLLTLLPLLSAGPVRAAPAGAAMDDPKGTAGVDDPHLARIVGRSWPQTLTSSPVWATQLGDHRHDDRLPDRSAEALARGRAHRDQLLARLDALGVASLDEGDRLTAELLHFQLDSDQAQDICAFETWAVNARANVLSEADWLPQAGPVHSLAAARAYLARVRALPRLADQDAALLRTGLSQGRVADAETLRRTVQMLDTELARPLEQWPLLGPLSDPELPAGLEPWKAELRATVDGPVRAAFTRYRDTVRDELLPAGRPDTAPGLSTLPGGDACYRAMIFTHTSEHLDPAEVHALGLRELSRIHAELAELGPATVGSADLPVILDRLRDDPTLRFHDREEILAEANAALDQAQAAVPDWFGRLPRTPCVVAEVPPQEAPWTYVAYYQPPFPGGARPGQYTVNTYAPQTRLRHEARVLEVHEGVPGHHLQIALAQELPRTPAFRRYMGLTVFVEGWALYAERLAEEMGLYRDDMDRMGALAFDAWRASRLVVDTGLHAQGWSRAQAVAFMRDNTPLADNNIDNEVDRYIGMPGQALGYKVGQLEILRLRQQAREALGERFDIRAFHDVVLGAGAVTLPILEARVQAWVAERAEPSVR